MLTNASRPMLADFKAPEVGTKACANRHGDLFAVYSDDRLFFTGVTT